MSAMRMTPAERGTMVAVVLGSGVVFLDSAVVNLALPQIARELPSSLLAPLEAQSYVVNGYFVTLSALLILAGALTDYHGRRRLFVLGLAAFALTSLLCALAPTMELLIAFRVLQGAAGALVVPGSLAIITSTFTGEQQGRAFGLWASASALTTILGPFVGGVLVHAFSWRLAFFVNLPILAVAVWAAMRYVAESRDEDAGRSLDWLGSVLAVLAVAGLAFGTIRGQQSEWQGAGPFLSLAVGVAATVALPIHLLRSTHPLVPPALFRSRNFTVTNASTFLVYGALYVALTFMGLFLIGTLGYNEPAAGLAMLPADVLLVLFSTRAGRLAARYGSRLFLALGPAVMAAGLLWLTRVPSTSTPWDLTTATWGSVLPPTDYLTHLFPGLVTFGLGLVLLVAPLTAAVMTSVPQNNAGVASAVNNAISRVGAPLVTGAIFVVVVSGFYGTLEERLPQADVSAASFRRDVAPFTTPAGDAGQAVFRAATDASTDAFHVAMLVAAGLMALGAVVNGFGIVSRRESPEHLGPEDTASTRDRRAGLAPARSCLVYESTGPVAVEPPPQQR
jgi:EmrB/QacA subfamily drug resistance transporter